MGGPRHLHRLSRRTVSQLAGAALLCALAVGILEWGRITPLRQIDAFFYDVFMTTLAKAGPGGPVVVVDIDDNSLSEVGQWPWPRYKVAQLVAGIQTGEPPAIGIDVIFPEPDRTALGTLRQAFRKEFGIELDLSNVPVELLDHDVFLGAVLSQSGAVGAIHLLFDQTNATAIRIDPPKGIRLTGQAERLDLLRARGVLLNTFRVQSQLRFCGFLNAKPDEDGEMRRIPLLMRFEDRVYPHLLLATLMRALGTDTVTVEHDRLGPLLRVGPHAIPVNADGTMLLRYRRTASAYPSISALEVLRSGVPPRELAGKVVFVGSSATALADLVSTPVDPQFPSLKVHAVAVDNILEADHLREPEWSHPASLLMSLLCGAAIVLLFVRSGSLPVLLLGSAGLLGVIVAASGALTALAGVYLTPSASATAIVLCFMFLSVARFAIERRRALVSLELVSAAQRVTIESMAAVAETRARETGGHIKRTQQYVRALAEQLARERKFPDVLTPEYVDWLSLSAPLHDIGKVAVRDSILLKPGRLDETEFQEMKQHTLYGQEIIAATSKSIQGDNFLRIASETASCHHEKWNGTGYPRGLSGDAIPLSARLMAVADVYDALISVRCYKAAFPHEEARELLVAGRGLDFDPVVVDAFLAIEQEIVDIAGRFRDSQEAKTEEEREG